jgi:hypothetical protein
VTTSPNPASVAFLDQYAAEIGARLDKIVSIVAGILERGEDTTIVFANLITRIADENLDPRTTRALLTAAVIRLAQQPAA